jgi:hypothetical protein
MSLISAGSISLDSTFKNEYEMAEGGVYVPYKVYV